LLIALGGFAAPWAARAADELPVAFDEAKLGDVIEQSVRISTGFFSKLVVLPGGRRELASRSARPSSSDGSYALGSVIRLFFQETSEGRLLRTLEYSRTRRPPASSGWTFLARRRETPS
jgi:hypothetical protein